MAIIKNLGLCVTIQVNGTPLHEFDDPDPCEGISAYSKAPHVCCKYVEVRDGAEYGTHVTTLPKNRWLSESAPNDRRLNIAVFIDGILQRHRCFGWKEQTQKGGDIIEGAVEHQSNHHRSIRKFKFSSLNTVDDAEPETIQRDSQRTNALGTIRVVLFRALKTGAVNASPCLIKDADLTVAEAAIKGKAVSHGTTLLPAAPVESTRNRPYHLSTTRKVDEQPYAIFTFKYRSLDALRSEMIIPRSPSPDVANDLLEGLSLDDIRRLASERIVQVNDEVKEEEKIKPEASGVKREFDDAFDLTGGLPRRMPRKRRERVTIDLTDD